MDKIKIPLSKANKKKFRDLYLQYYLKDAPDNINDESLIKAVQDYEAKQNPNSENGTKPEGTENEAGKAGNAKSDEQLRQEAVKRFVEVAGQQPSEELTTDEINAESLTLENRKEGSKKYFDLFGSQPTETMTNDQIFNAIEVKEKEIAELNEPKEKKPEAFEYNPETQVVAQHRDTNEIRIFNKQTMRYLKEWKELPRVPKEIQ